MDRSALFPGLSSPPPPSSFPIFLPAIGITVTTDLVASRVPHSKFPSHTESRPESIGCMRWTVMGIGPSQWRFCWQTQIGAEFQHRIGK